MDACLCVVQMMEGFGTNPDVVVWKNKRTKKSGPAKYSMTVALGDLNVWHDKGKLGKPKMRRCDKVVKAKAAAARSARCAL